MNKILFVILFNISALALIFSCHKRPAENLHFSKLNYGDSVLYKRPIGESNIIYPKLQRKGIYTSFPDGLKLDKTTGAIDLSQSETGLRYRVFFKSNDGEKDSINLVVSGINYTDHYYNLSQGDSIAYPIYNARLTNNLPCNSGNCSFDEEQQAFAAGCTVSPKSGQINLLQSVRRGLFGSQPVNNARRDIDISYRLHDQSGKALNTIKVRLYYFRTAQDVPAYLKDLLAERQKENIFLDEPIGVEMSTNAVIKPRPPCIIIIGR